MTFTAWHEGKMLLYENVDWVGFLIEVDDNMVYTINDGQSSRCEVMERIQNISRCGELCREIIWWHELSDSESPVIWFCCSIWYLP